MAEQAPPDPAGRLVDTLLEEGEAVDEGVFTLDAAAAARKLAAFTHGDRNRYLLPIVEGLHRLGAREIQVETVDEDLRIRAFGLRLREPERDLAQIHGYALGRSEHEEGRGLGRLALGLDMVLGNGTTERALLRYFNTGVSLEFEFRHGQAPTLRRVTPKVLGELCVEIDHPWLRSLVDDDQKTALTALRHAALRSPRKITLDGRLISQVERDWFDTVTGEGPGYRFSAGLEQGRELPASVVELWTGGLSFSKLAFEGVAFTAVLELDDPRRDLTGMGIVHDEVVAAALVEIDAARLELLERLDRADADWSPEQRPARWSLHRVDAVLGRPLREVSTQALVPVSETSPAVYDPYRPLPTRWVVTRPRSMVALAADHGAVGVVASLFLATAGVLILWVLAAVAPPIDAAISNLQALGMFLLALAPVPAIPGLVRAGKAKRARDHGLRLTARISDVVPASLGYGRVTWTFSDPEGNEHQGRSLPRAIEEAKLWEPGEEIAVYYDPGEPRESYWEAEVGPRSE